MQKKTAKISSIITAMMLSLSFCLVACSNNPPPYISVSESIVTIEMYPTIELILDQSQTVTAANAKNFDAEILLFNSTNIVKQNINTAVDSIASLAVKMNYVSATNTGDRGNIISVSVSSISESNATSIYNSVKVRLENTLKRQNITASVVRAIKITDRFELDKIKKNPSNKDKIEYGEALNLERYKLVKSALFVDIYLTLDAAVKLSDTQLIKLISHASSTRLTSLPKAYKSEYRKIQFPYDTLKQYLLDMPYITAYNDDVEAPANYGTVFYAYRAAQCAINQGYTTLNDTYSNPQISENDALEILKTLGIVSELAPKIKEKITEDKTAAGIITKNSLSNYINWYYRNANSDLQNVMNVHMSYAQLIFDNISSAAIKTDEKLQGAVTNAINSINGVYKNISNEVIAEIGVEIDKWKSTNITDINAILAELSEQIDKVYAIMQNNLTDKKLAEIEKGVADNKITLGDLTTKYKPNMDALNLKWQGVLQNWQDTLQG